MNAKTGQKTDQLKKESPAKEKRTKEILNWKPNTVICSPAIVARLATNYLFEPRQKVVVKTK